VLASVRTSTFSRCLRTARKGGVFI
jgi:hypothetical protein